MLADLPGGGGRPADPGRRRARRRARRRRPGVGGLDRGRSASVPPSWPRAPRLAFVQQGSVGVEHYDLAALAAAGVPLANTAGANAVSVAEWCVGSTFALLRQLVWADAQVRAGAWPQLDLAARGSARAGRQAGRRARASARSGRPAPSRFAALGCAVSYSTRRRRPAEEEHGATYVDLDTLLATSEVLVVVVALAPETRGLLDAAALARLPRGALLVNAARGGIVDEDAVVAALRHGRARRGGVRRVRDRAAAARARRCAAATGSCCTRTPPGATVQAQFRILGQTVANLRRVVLGEAPSTWSTASPASCGGAGEPPVRVRRRRRDPPRRTRWRCCARWWTGSSAGTACAPLVGWLDGPRCAHPARPPWRTKPLRTVLTAPGSRGSASAAGSSWARRRGSR